MRSGCQTFGSAAVAKRRRPGAGVDGVQQNSGGGGQQGKRLQDAHTLPTAVHRAGMQALLQNVCQSAVRTRSRRMATLCPPQPHCSTRPACSPCCQTCAHVLCFKTCVPKRGAHPLPQDGHDALQLRIAARGFVRLQNLPAGWAGGKRTSVGMQAVRRQQQLLV